MALENDFAELENDPEFQALKASDPKRAANLARFAARKLAQTAGVRGTDPRVKGFLERNLPTVSGFKGTGLTAAKAIAGEATKAGFQSTFAGSLAKATGLSKPVEPIDIGGAYQQVFSGEYGIPSLPEVGIGLASAGGAVLGLAPDIALGGGAGFLLRRGGASTAKILAGEAALGGGMTGGQAALEGRSPSEIAAATSIGAGLGLGAAALGVKAAQAVRRPAALGAPSAPGPRAITPDIAPQVPAGARQVSPRAPRGLPAPGQTSQPRDFGARPLPPAPPTATEAQFLSPDAANAAVASARSQRAAAEAELNTLSASGREAAARARVESLSQPATSKAAENKRVAALAQAQAQLAQERAAISAAEERLIASVANEQSVIEAAARAVEQRRAADLRQARAAYEAANAPRGPIPGQPPRVPPGLAAPEPIPGALPAPPGSTATWVYTAAPRGFSEQAMYGAPPVPPVEPIIPPAPAIRQALPPPSGSQIIPPAAPTVVPFSEQALSGMVTPRGIPMPPPREPLQLPPPAGPEIPFVGPSVAGFSPGALYGQAIPPAQRAATTQAARDVAGEIQRLSQPALPPANIPLLPAPPAPMPRGMEQAMYGAFQPPSVSPQFVARIQQERLAAEAELKRLMDDAGKMTKEKQAAINAARDAVIGAQTAEINAIRRLRETMAPPAAPAAPPAAAPAKGKPASKKKGPTNLDDTPLMRLIREEGGSATPEGALGVLTTAAGAAGRTVMTGARAFAKAIADRAPAAAELVQRLGDAESKVIDDLVGRYGGNVFVRAGDAAVAAVDGMLANNGAGVPPELRQRAIDAINAMPGTTWDDKVRAFKAKALSRPDLLGNETLDPAFNWVRGVFSSTYGATPEALRIKQVAREAAIAAARPFEELIDRIISTRPDVDNVEIYRGITDESYAGSDLDVLQAKTLIGNMEAALRDLGVITKEQFDKFNSTYLPREYAKYLWGNPDTNETLKAMYKVASDKVLQGWHSRGITKEMTQRELSEALARGEKWRVTSKAGRGENVYAWRDYTRDERKQWGEVEHAGRQLLRYVFEAQNAFERGAFLDGLSKGVDEYGAFSIPETAVYTPGPGIPRPANYIDPTTGQEYVYLEGRMDRGINSLGNLAGRYVRGDIASYALSNDEMFRGYGEKFINAAVYGSQWLKRNTLVDYWKRLKTTFNAPMYLLNNLLVGPTALVQHGGSMFDIPKAIVMSMQGESNEIFARAMQKGYIRDGAKLRELATRIDPILRHLANTTNGVVTPQTWARAVDAALAVAKNPKQYKTVLQPAVAAVYKPIAEMTRGGIRQVDKLAQNTDDMFVLALAEGLHRRRGKSIDEALDIARDAFYNPKNFNSIAVQGTEGLIPFIKVGNYTIDSYLTGMATNPHRALYLAFLGTSIPYAAAALGAVKGGSIEERIEKYKAEQELLPKRMRTGGLGYGLPLSIPMYTNEQGQTVYGDLSAASPFGQFEMTEGLRGVPKMLTPGGFVPSAAQYITNKDWFTGKPIIEESKIEGMPPTYDYSVEFAKRQLLPPLAYNFFEATKTTGAFPPSVPLVGGSSARGLEYGLPEQTLRMLGVKATPIEPAKQARIVFNQYETQEKNERQQLNQARRRLIKASEAGRLREIEIMTSEVERRLATIREINQRKAEIMQRIAPAFEGGTPAPGDVLSEPDSMGFVK